MQLNKAIKNFLATNCANIDISSDKIETIFLIFLMRIFLISNEPWNEIMITLFIVLLFIVKCFCDISLKTRIDISSYWNFNSGFFSDIRRITTRCRFSLLSWQAARARWWCFDVFPSSRKLSHLAFHSCPSASLTCRRRHRHRRRCRRRRRNTAK